MNCPWCDQPSMAGMNGFCSVECQQEADREYELYLDWYNDYMSGYDVPSFEKITKRKRREEA